MPYKGGLSSNKLVLEGLIIRLLNDTRRFRGIAWLKLRESNVTENVRICRMNHFYYVIRGLDLAVWSLGVAAGRNPWSEDLIVAVEVLI